MIHVFLFTLFKKTNIKLYYIILLFLLPLALKPLRTYRLPISVQDKVLCINASFKVNGLEILILKITVLDSFILHKSNLVRLANN